MEQVTDNGGRTRKPGASAPPSTTELDQLIPAYHFLQYIDSGGMGAVYKAVQRCLNRTVAVKLLPRVHLEKEGFLERFKREAQALALLNHPNIVAVYDFGETADGQLYYVMEYVQGMDLSQLIKRDPPGPPQILQIVTQVCQALQYAHDRGIVHRDIKPANILIDQHGNVKVADFGLAKIVGPQVVDYTATGTTLGTPDYIAPEAMEYGVKVDHRVDIYSLGVMIYELLTGYVPKGEWELPSVRSGADKRMDAVVTRAMQNDPNKRYQSVGDLTAVLQKLQRSGSNWKHYRRPSRISILQPRGGVVVGESAAASTNALTQKVVNGRLPARKGRLLPWVVGVMLAVGGGLTATWQVGWRDAKSGEEMQLKQPHGQQAAVAAPAAGITPLQQKFLAWIFQRSGFVNVTTTSDSSRATGGGADIWKFEDLPAEPFAIWRVCFSAAGAPITSEDTFKEMVSQINELGTVSNLGLRGLDVLPSALEELSSIETLTSLDLTDSTAVTLEAVPYLSSCQRLRLLRIGSTSETVNPAIVDELRVALPECSIKVN